MPVETNRQDPPGGRRDLLLFLTAVIALLGFAWFILYLLGRTTSASELEWTRAVYLLSGGEAIAFAAAGFLFGREVNRQRAEAAETRAEGAALEAVEARGRAIQAQTRGADLAAAVRAKVQAQAGKASTFEAFGPEQTAGLTRADFEELANLADKLFPAKS